jgi:UDP-glucose 4-epimerase
MRVLISGGHGFLGRHLVRDFIARGAEVAVVARPAAKLPVAADTVRSYSLALPSGELSHVLREFKPDVFVHCAGKASVPASIEDPHADFLSHVVVTESVLHAIRTTTPSCKFVYLSSAAVYGQPLKLPVDEHAPCSPVSPYGFHKHMAEMLVREASEIHGLHTLVIRIFSAYGAGLQRQVVWEMCRQAVHAKRIVLSGTGEEKRDFIHATDVASAVGILVNRDTEKHDVFNVASGTSRSIKEVAESIGKLGGGVSVEFQGQINPGDPPDWRADISKLRATGFRPSVQMDEGLLDVLAYAQSTI